MELPEKEKERIIAEEKVRFEAKRQLWKDAAGGHGWGGEGSCGGWGRRRGVWKGFLLGILVSWIFGTVVCKRWSHCSYDGGYGMMGRGCAHGSMWDKQGNEGNGETTLEPAPSATGEKAGKK